MRRARAGFALAAVACAALALPAAAGPRATLTVFAAASLREAFAEIGSAFEKDHPGARVDFSFAGSQELRLQIEQGASADVFASADLRHLRALRAQGLVGEPRVFARNRLALVVPRGNPQGLRELRDLPRARRVVLAAPEVPAGAYAAALLEGAGRLYGPAFARDVEARVVSREPNVRQVLAKVELGEADAGLVYRSDAQAACGRVEVVPLPDGLVKEAEYPLAAVSGSKQPAMAAAFVDLVLSPAGQAALERRGFGGAVR